MAPLTFSHLSSDTFEQESQKKAGRKRPRIREAVSCWQCRSRKIRCDREVPCRPCIERGAGSRCAYNQNKASSSTTASTSKPSSPRAHDATSNDQTKQTVGEEAVSDKASPQSTTSASFRPVVAAPKSATASSPTALHTRTQHNTQSLPDRTTTTPNQPFQGHIIQRTNRKTRFIGVSHWMAPCNEMMVINAMVNRTHGFKDSMEEFSELKEHLRLANNITAILPPYPVMLGPLSASILLSVLPDRSSCEQWIGRYFQSYGRIYHIVDATTLASDLHQAFSCPADERRSYATALDSVYILRILMTVALGMQMSEPHRIHGRRLGCLVRDFVHSAARVQKPCTGSLQVLLQLILLGTVMGSDIEGEYDNMGLLGLTNNIVLRMGLHRDPEIFPGASPYFMEQRKCLWACFLRLNLASCIRTGAQLNLRLEDSDCPLPTPSILSVPLTTEALDESTRNCIKEWTLDDKSAQNDASFNYACAKLANVVAPVHQVLCSAKPRVTVEQQKELQLGFAALVEELPPSLQSGTTVTDPIVELQRALISVGMHSFLLVVSMSFILRNTTAELVASGDFATQRPQLLEIWDLTTSILSQFQSLSQKESEPKTQKTRAKSKSKSLPPPEYHNAAASDTSAMAHHLMWTDAGRAALSGCLVVGRLRRHDIDKTMPFSVHPRQQHTASIFQHMLTQSLFALLDLWRSKSHLGPVTAKISMVIAVAIAVTNSLYTDFDGIFDKGVEAAKQQIAEIKLALEKQQANRPTTRSRARDSAISMEDAAAATTAVNQFATTQAPQQLPITTTGLHMMPTSTVSIPFTSLGTLPPQMVPLTSPQTWVPMPLAGGGPPQLSDLSAAGSSAGSQTTTPDFIGMGGNASGSGNEMFGLDFGSDMSFPYAISSSFDAGCALMGDFDSTFLDFSSDTVINMF